MKKLLIISISICCGYLGVSQKHSGVFPYIDGKIHFTKVVTVDSSIGKETLIKNAIIWFEKTTTDYNNSINNKESYGLKDNTILKNINTGEFVGTLNMIVQQSLSQSLIGFDVYIYAKDGKYKYDFTDFKYLGNSLENKMAGRNMNSVTSMESADKSRFKKLMALIYKSCLSAIEKLNEQMVKQSLADF